MITIGIADDNTALRDIIKNIVSAEADMEMIWAAADGRQAVGLLKEKMPDVLILDNVMPYYDGFEVMERLHKMDADAFPKVIMLTAMGQEVATAKAVKLGVDYYLLKPFDAKVLIERIRNVTGKDDTAAASKGKTPTQQLETQVSELMRKMGVPSNVRGYQYIRQAVVMCSNDARYINALTKELYPAIAEIYDTSANSVERSIRNAIILALDKGNVEFIKELLGNAKPTNSAFISMIAEYIKMH